MRKQVFWDFSKAPVVSKKIEAVRRAIKKANAGAQINRKSLAPKTKLRKKITCD